jgi:hypothetical protein
MAKLRPQIIIGILCATLIAGMGMYIGWRMDAVEVVTAIAGSIFGFLGGVSMKVLESE